MRGLLLVVVLLGAAATHAKRVSGALEPVPTAADVRFAQQHERQHARAGSEAPDWWHYVAPWWSPPEHDATKAPPDFVEETPAFKHFREPPANTMPVYVPYGRDAMSSFVETETHVNSYGPQTAALMRQRMASEDAFMQPQSPEQMMQQYMAHPQAVAQAAQPRPLYAGLDSGFGPMPTAGMRYPMPRFAAAESQQQQASSQAQSGASAATVAGAPPTMPSFPAVPQFDSAANEFALPAVLQMSPYEEMLKRALHPEMAQRAVYGNSGPAAGAAYGPSDAMRFAGSEAGAKQSEAMEDARWAQMADEEFGAHARAAQNGGQVPRIWRTDREAAGDLADERDFESAASDAEAEADAQDAQEAHGADAESDAAAEAADAQFAFRQRHDRAQSEARDAAEAAEAEADAEEEAADERDNAAAQHRHDSGMAEAQRLRAASAAQFDAEDESSAGAADVSQPFSAYRFQQIGDDEADASDSDAEADAELDEELDQEEEEEQEHEHEHEHAGEEGDSDEQEEVLVEAGAEADAEADVDALLEREADAMERASDRRLSRA